MTVSILKQEHEHNVVIDSRNQLEELSFETTLKLLGSGEKSVFDPEFEQNGVAKVLQSLTDDEITEMPDTNMPLRHFRAEKGNVSKAIEKIKATLKWRREFEVHNIVHAYDTASENDSNREQRKRLRNILEQENATGKMYVRGYDKDGRALMYMHPAKENTYNMKNNMIHLVYMLERAIACTTRKTHGKFEKICFIQNYGGYNLRNAPPLKTTKYTMHILQDHYPERMHRSYVCNPPFVFKSFWSLIKPIIDPNTKEKFVFCSRSDDNWKKLQTSVEHKLDQALHDDKCNKFDYQLRPYDHVEFLKSPFNITFDEI